MTKKYKLHCFRCGILFRNKEGVNRLDGKPYCAECEGEILTSRSEYEIYSYEERKFAEKYRREVEYCKKNNLPPPETPEEAELRRHLIRKYGEY